MADNVAITAGSGTTIATDDVSSVHYQRIKLDAGDDGATAPVVDKAVPSVLVPTGGKIVKLQATPTVTAGAYSANDAVGGKLTFTDAARASGGSIVIEAAIIGDKSSALSSVELWLFDADFTAVADNAAFDPDDADLGALFAIIPFSIWYAAADNGASVRSGLGITAKLAGTSLYGQLVTRTGPTLVSTSDVYVTLHVIQN